jgi:hypothetical protein
VNTGHTTTVDDTVDLSPLDEPAPAPAEDGRRVEGYRRDGPEPEPRRGPGRLLRVLAGVDETVLDHAPSERPRYTALGGVVLSTATVAAFSMAMALHQVLGHNSAVTILPVLGWFLIILNLDRWLVSTTSPLHLGRMVLAVLPRLLMAVVFGVIIAEPLVLRVFETAVERQVEDSRQQDLVKFQSDLEICNGLTVAGAAPSARGGAQTGPADCSEGKRLNVTVPTPAALAEQLAQLRKQHDDLAVGVAADAAELAKLNEAARRECNGTSGPGLTGRFGVGPSCERLRGEADTFERTHDIAARVEARDQLQARIKELEQQRADAATTYEAAIRLAIAGATEERARHQQEIGLLERFEALDELVAHSRFLWVNRWLLTLFFVIFDCLPILVKLFSGNSQYEQMVEDRLRGARERFADAVETETARHRASLEVQRHAAESAARLERERIDDARRVEAANRSVDPDDEVDALAARILAQSQTRGRPDP